MADQLSFEDEINRKNADGGDPPITGHASADAMLKEIRDLLGAQHKLSGDLAKAEKQRIKASQDALKLANQEVKVAQQLSNLKQKDLLASTKELEKLEMTRRDPVTGKRLISAQTKKGKWKELTIEEAQGLSEEEFQRQIRDPAMQRAKQTGVLDTPDKSFRWGELAKAGARGDIGGVLGEVLQSGKHQKMWGERLEERGANAAAGSFSRRVLPGMGRMLAKTPLLGAVVGAQQVLSRSIKLRNAGIQMGQLTGGGLAEGAEAARQGVSLSLNPFDRIDRRTGLAISKGVRGEGFQGDQAGDVTDAIGGMVNDLGIEWSKALELTVAATVDGKQSLDEFRTTMEGLDDVAKSSGNSISQVVEGFAGMQDWFLNAGGPQLGRTAGAINQTLLESTGKGSRMTPAQWKEIFSPATAQIVGADAGLDAGQINLPENMNKLADRLRDFLLRLWDAWEISGLHIPGSQIDAWAVMMYDYGDPTITAMFPNADAFVRALKWANRLKGQRGTTSLEDETKKTNSENALKTAKKNLKGESFLSKVGDALGYAGAIAKDTSILALRDPSKIGSNLYRDVKNLPQYDSPLKKQREAIQSMVNTAQINGVSPEQIEAMRSNLKGHMGDSFGKQMEFNAAVDRLIEALDGGVGVEVKVKDGYKNMIETSQSYDYRNTYGKGGSGSQDTGPRFSPPVGG